MKEATTDREKEFKEAYDQSWAAFGGWQVQAHKDIGNYLGTDIYTAREQRRAQLLGVDLVRLQLIRRIIKWVAGYQRDHRLSIKYEPIEGADDQTAGDATECITWRMQANDGYNTISDGFEHALKSGLCLVNVFNDQNFDTQLALAYYNQFLLDPNFTRIDLGDCQYGIMRKYITSDQAKILLPSDYHKLIDEADKNSGNVNNMFPNYPSPKMYGKGLIAYDEFQQKTSVERKYVLIKPMQREFPFNGPAKELKDLIQMISLQTGLSPELFSTITRREMTVKVTGFVNGKEAMSEEDPFGIGDFSFTPILAFFDPEYDKMEDKLQGLVRCLVEPQRTENKRFMAMNSWFDQKISSGVDYEENALVDEEDAFASGPGKPRKLKEGAIDKIRDRVVQDLPQGMVQLSQMMQDMMPKMVNMNETMFGDQKGNEQIAGIVQQLRMGTGLQGLRGLFDNLSLSQKCIGRKLLKLIQQYPTEKIRRILNRDPSPEFQNKRFGQYDAEVAEGLLTSSQRNTFYYELVNLKRLGQELQDPAPFSWETLIKYAPVQMRQDLMKEIQAKEQAKAQMQARQQKIAEILQQLEIQGRQAEIMDTQTQSMERRTKAVGNMVKASLDEAKTITENQKAGKTGQDAALEPIDRLIEVNKLMLEKREQDLKMKELKKGLDV